MVRFRFIIRTLRLGGEAETSAKDDAAAPPRWSLQQYISYGILRLNFHVVLNNKIMTAAHEGAISKHSIIDWDSRIVVLLHHGGII